MIFGQEWFIYFTYNIWIYTTSKWFTETTVVFYTTKQYAIPAIHYNMQCNIFIYNNIMFIKTYKYRFGFRRLSRVDVILCIQYYTKPGVQHRGVIFSLSYRSDIIIYTRATLRTRNIIYTINARSTSCRSSRQHRRRRVFNIFTTNIIIAPIYFRANTAIAASPCLPYTHHTTDKLIITIIRLRYFHFFSPFIFTTCLFLPTKPIATIYITIRVYGIPTKYLLYSLYNILWSTVFRIVRKRWPSYKT